MRRALLILFLILLINSAYIGAFAFPTVFYVGNVLLHCVLGIAAAAGLAWLLWKDREFLQGNVPALVLLCGAALAGFYLVRFGAVTENRWALYGHVALAVAGSAALARHLWRWRGVRKPLLACLALLVVL